MSSHINLLANLPSEFYSYLLSKTKAEKELLEFLGYQIEKNEKLKSRVEYTNKKYNCSRIDLALLDNNLVPVEIIEAKFYYSFNGYRIYDQQLAKKSEVEKDIKKLKEISNSIKKYFVLFLVHFRSNDVPELFPYSNTHNKVMLDFISGGLNNSDLRSQSIAVTTQFLKSKGLEPNIKEFDIGVYDKIPIILQVFLCPVR